MDTTPDLTMLEVISSGSFSDWIHPEIELNNMEIQFELKFIFRIQFQDHRSPSIF